MLPNEVMRVGAWICLGLCFIGIAMALRGQKEGLEGMRNPDPDRQYSSFKPVLIILAIVIPFMAFSVYDMYLKGDPVATWIVSLFL